MMPTPTPLTPFEVFGDDDAVPMGIRVGDLIHAGRITGTGEGVQAQLQHAFANLRQVIERAGAGLDNIAQVSFFLKQRQDIAAINSPWVEMFPDNQDRPTYKFMLAELPGEQLVQMEAFALVGARRRMLHIPGVAHTNPIPMGVRIGDMLFSSRVLPYDPATGKPADGVERQAKFLFGNVRRLLEVGGIEARHITQGRLFLAQPGYRDVALEHWRTLVRSMQSQPVLHITAYTLAPSLQVMLEVIANKR